MDYERTRALLGRAMASATARTNSASLTGASMSGSGARTSTSLGSDRNNPTSFSICSAAQLSFVSSASDRDGQLSPFECLPHKVHDNLVVGRGDGGFGARQIVDVGNPIHWNDLHITPTAHR